MKITFIFPVLDFMKPLTRLGTAKKIRRENRAGSGQNHIEGTTVAL